MGSASARTVQRHWRGFCARCVFADLFYAACVESLWQMDGALLGNPTIMLPNVTAIVMGAGYCATFWRYRSPTASVLPYFAGSAAMIGTTVGVSLALPTATALSFIG